MSQLLQSTKILPSEKLLAAAPTPIRMARRVLDALPEGRAIAEEVWQRRHKAMRILLWLHAAAILGYALATQQTIWHSLFEASIVAGCGVAAHWGPKGRRFQSVTVTLGLVSSSAILVHLSGGLIEMHFHYFVSLAVVSLYHDWAPFLTAIAFVAVQHGAVGVLDPHSVYNHGGGILHPWKWAGIHASFVLAASAVSLVRWKSSEVEALKDPLTWLPNRALFGDRLRQALARREATGDSVAMLFLDVDDFKSINDTAGHLAGDRLLIVVADRLRSVVRPADTVARLGGDEFAMVLEDADEATAKAVAKRVEESVRAPMCFEGRKLTITASIGIAVATDDAVTEAELVRNADIAMYVAKRSGKGRFSVFEPSMHRAVVERSELAKELEGAIERAEMRVVYQPVVVLADGSVTGFEALVRWQHPRFGLFGPAKFIPLSEETGDIVSIGRWVLETACAQAMAWEDEFPSARRTMSVNVSVRQLVDPGFVGHVEHALGASGLPPERLVLELTESAMVGESAEVISQLHRVKALGVRIALDDFGTGYSSLGYLRRLPIDILKIDKTFVDGTDQGTEEAALARAILKIAESMGLQCVAEGVERETQARALRTAGCALAQGYLFSKPIEAHRVDALLLLDPQPAQPRGTILVAEGDATVRQLLARRLEAGGFAIVEAGSAAEAGALLGSGPVDLLVLDAAMPGAAALMERIESLAAPVPVLCLTEVPGSIGRAAVLGRAGEVIHKPYRADEVLSNVHRILARSA